MKVWGACKLLAITALAPSLALAQQWTAAQRGWLYVLDVEDGNGHGRVLLIDPSQTTPRGTFVTDYHPDFGVCPDGSRLYVVDGTQSSGSLSIIDTQSGKLVSKVAFPDRAIYTVRPAQPGIACSTDGRWLFIQLMKTLSPGADQHSIAVVDSSTGRLASIVPLPGCGVGQVVPWPLSDWTAAVECSFTNSLHLVSVDSMGNVLQTKDVALKWAAADKPDGVPAQIPERLTSSVVADPVHGLMNIFRSGGGMDQLDPNTLLIEPKFRDTWQRWTPRAGVLSPTGLFYLGFLPYGELTQPEGLLNQVAVFATANWSEVADFTTPRPFWSLAISQDGQILYAVDPRGGSITAIDTSTMKPVQTISVGGEPSLILVQP